MRSRAARTRIDGPGARAAGTAVFRVLLRRELSERHQGTLAGWAWGLLQPLLQFVVLVLVFTRLLPARASGDALPYAAFLALGLWPWQLFANALLRGTTALTDNAAMIGKVVVPNAYYVLTRMAGAAIYDLAGFALVLALLFAFRMPITLAGLPVAVLALLVIAAHGVAAGFVLATLQVFLRDAAQVVAQLISLGFFLSPVLYDRNQLPGSAGRMLAWNPLAPPIEALRAALTGTAIDWPMLAYSAMLAIGALLVARWLFRRAQPHVEDFL
jgi:ABC-type polysaccharide/polyol phosphate export permease